MVSRRKSDDQLEELQNLREHGVLGGGASRIDKQHQMGKLTARERIDLLVDEGTFCELDSFMVSRSSQSEKEYLGDAVVTGYGKVSGRLVFIYSQDFTVYGGSLSEVAAEKVCKVMDHALSTGAPMVG